jgi:hypothetical protein
MIVAGMDPDLRQDYGQRGRITINVGAFVASSADGRRTSAHSAFEVTTVPAPRIRSGSTCRPVDDRPYPASLPATSSGRGAFLSSPPP